ncbi:MAG: rod shape-determining protein MreD [Sphingobium sp.]|nr:rod shape-determining protein MreD [Sphingobium sp.]MCP5399983.1 rod shape-determining protein MreD [Sphingomonas sp.]
MTMHVPKLGNTPSRWRLEAIPIACVILASALPSLLPVLVQSPTLPPLGLLFLLGWRLLHRELWPLWIGAPLGLADDILSGHPIGTAVFLWTLIMIAVETIDQRLMWRDYWHDWLIAIVACLFFLCGGIILSWLAGSSASLQLILPQTLWSALLYPLIVRVIARVDRWRMMA